MHSRPPCFHLNNFCFHQDRYDQGRDGCKSTCSLVAVSHDDGTSHRNKARSRSLLIQCFYASISFPYRGLQNFHSALFLMDCYDTTTKAIESNPLRYKLHFALFSSGHWPLRCADSGGVHEESVLCIGERKAPSELCLR